MKEWFVISLVPLSRIAVAFLLWLRSGPSVFWTPDTAYYVEPARSLLHGSFASFGLPEFFRTPGYPLLLIPAVVSGHVVIVGLIENFLFATVAAWLIWRISWFLFPGTSAAKYAVLLYCFEPLGFLHSERLMSETAFTAALLLFIWLFLRFLHEPSVLTAAFSAAALAGATYIRPASLYLGLCMAALIVFLPRNVLLRYRVASAAIFLAVIGLLLAPWIVRNALLVNYNGFSSAGDWNLYFFSSAAIQARLEHRTLIATSTALGANNDSVYFKNHPERISWTRGRVASTWGSEARQTIAGHWTIYLPIHAKGCAIVVFDPGVTEVLKSLRLYPEDGGLMGLTQTEGFAPAVLWLVRRYPIAMVILPLMALQVGLYYVLAALGLRWLPDFVRVTFLTTTLYFILISGMPAATGRYRVPVMPMVCISAGVILLQRHRKFLSPAVRLPQLAKAGQSADA